MLYIARNSGCYRRGLRMGFHEKYSYGYDTKCKVGGMNEITHKNVKDFSRTVHLCEIFRS